MVFNKNKEDKETKEKKGKKKGHEKAKKKRKAQKEVITTKLSYKYAGNIKNQCNSLI
jgi:hypothetical protein